MDFLWFGTEKFHLLKCVFSLSAFPLRALNVQLRVENLADYGWKEIFEVAFCWLLSGREEQERGLGVKPVQHREPAEGLDFASVAGGGRASWWGGDAFVIYLGSGKYKNK